MGKYSDREAARLNQTGPRFADGEALIAALRAGPVDGFDLSPHLLAAHLLQMRDLLQEVAGLALILAESSGSHRDLLEKIVELVGDDD